MNPLASLRLACRSLLDLLLPRRCYLCGCRLALHEHNVCPWCIRRLTLNTNTNWEANQRIAQYVENKDILRMGAYAMYHRDGAVAALIHALKYEGRYELGQWMGRLAATELKDTGLFDDVDVLVPIPLALQRRLKRGYNQAELLAKGISEVTGIPVRTDILRRTVNNVSQTRVEFSKRYSNAQGIFGLCRNVNPDELKGLHIMLVDDVMTTGTTMRSAIQVLEQLPNVRLSAFAWAWTHLKPKPSIPSL